MERIIIVLGAPNDDQGNLSAIAIDRLCQAHQLYIENPSYKLMCTGGFGMHFNRTDKPHFHYAQQFLENKGIPQTAFLPSPLSSNTIEDFTLIKNMLDEIQPEELVLVTSDFHMKRVKIVFQKIISYPKVAFVSAPSSLSAAELKILIAHEQQAIARLNSNEIR